MAVGMLSSRWANIKDAKMDFDRAIKIYPNDAEVFYWRAFTKYRMRASASSEISDYNRAILLKTRLC
jgi:hypothetical protein